MGWLHDIITAIFPDWKENSTAGETAHYILFYVIRDLVVFITLAIVILIIVGLIRLICQCIYHGVRGVKNRTRWGKENLGVADGGDVELNTWSTQRGYGENV